MMNHSYRSVVIVAVVSGVIFLTLVYNLLSEVAAVIIAFFSIAFTIVTFVILRNVNKPEEYVEQFGEADILNRMWYPIQDELTDVVKRGGRVTEPASAWTTAPGLSKRETEGDFFSGMQRYVRQREHVASLASGDLATEESRQKLTSEQETLLSMAQELIVKVNMAIDEIPASRTISRRSGPARPSPTRATATRRSPRARRPASASRRSRARTSTSAQASRHQPAPSRPTSAPMRIADTAETSERAVAPPAPRVPEPRPKPPAPPPPKITYTPTPSPPVVPPPGPREPELPAPPSAPPTPSPVTASVPEPAEPVKRPEPVAATPAPREPEPPAPPSAPTGDVRLDVASVCEDLFDPKRMSYETNRLFDERYKDATVRWKGTARRASVYSYDFEFGDGGGTKAELDVYEVKQQYGSRAAKAVVQLPVEAAEDLDARIGEDVQFEGRLMTCEGSARRLYVAEARMVG